MKKKEVEGNVMELQVSHKYANKLGTMILALNDVHDSYVINDDFVNHYHIKAGEHSIYDGFLFCPMTGEDYYASFVISPEGFPVMLSKIMESNCRSRGDIFHPDFRNNGLDRNGFPLVY